MEQAVCHPVWPSCVWLSTNYTPVPTPPNWSKFALAPATGHGGANCLFPPSDRVRPMVSIIERIVNLTPHDAWRTVARPRRP